MEIADRPLATANQESMDIMDSELPDILPESPTT